ncbi:DUF6498-containing protein [Cutibacterium equinum]|uniref:DUF6498-containing protein n=1 Tax=Cutibacterium equinum TaxID=3016342 RepID=A0ABY7QYT4_9ACTN|nr:DUF6498-containing protein [Cutibacterium equinum]WCC80201.1 DUF6498-containing protein [Cutibacterium equinum]
MTSTNPPFDPEGTPRVRRSLTTYWAIITYNLATAVGVVVFDWPVGNILLLGWCENVMFVIAATLANGRVQRESRRTGLPIPVDPSAVQAGNMSLDATAPPFAYLLSNLFFSIGHLVFAGVLAVFVGVKMTITAAGVPFVLAVVRHIVEAFNDFLGDPAVRRAKDLRAARDANWRVVVQHVFILVAWGLFIGALNLADDHLGHSGGLGHMNFEARLHVVAVGVLLLYVTAKIVVEVLITRARDRVQPLSSLADAL